MKVRIKSENGEFYGSSIALDGIELQMVTAFTVTADVKHSMRATVEMILPEIDVVAEADVLVTVLGKKMKKYRLVPIEGAT